MEAGPLISNTCLQTHSFTTKLNQMGTPLQDNDYGVTGVAMRQGVKSGSTLVRGPVRSR